VIESPTLAEWLGALIVVVALGVSLWALVDDVWDLVNVRRFGEVGGPRWIAAYEHFLFNMTLLGGWLCFLGVIAIAIYLPTRTDLGGERYLSDAVGWLRIGYAFMVLWAQIHRRVGRVRLQRLPLEAWERMLAAMVGGLSIEDRRALTNRLLTATGAGRDLGHTVANHLTAPMAMLSLLEADPRLTAEERSDIAVAVRELELMAAEVPRLHAAIKSLERPA
jgi:hypothetical protein